MQRNKIAIYPGTFNPFTIGHLNIAEKADAIFGKENTNSLIKNPPASMLTDVASGLGRW